jgi:hypothetical protein
LPDIEKPDEGEEPTRKQLGPDVPMRQGPKSEENQSGKKNSMLIVLREKVSESKSAGRHFLKKRGSPIPFIPNWVSTPFLNIRRPIAAEALRLVATRLACAIVLTSSRASRGIPICYLKGSAAGFLD